MLKHNPTQKEIAEYERKNIEVFNKYDRGDKLTKAEKYFLCDNVRHSEILNYPICEDEFYYKYYLDRDFLPKLHTWNIRHKLEFEKILKNWVSIIADERNSDPVLKIIAEETRKELKAHRNAHGPTSITYDKPKYDKQTENIYAWSKFRSVVINRTLNLYYKNGEFNTTLNGHQVVLNETSLVHILTRHFGKDLKPYKSGKDFFSKHFLHDNLHMLLPAIFAEIDAINAFKPGRLIELNIIYKGDIYKLYFNEKHKFQKGVATQKQNLLTTFFPVGDKTMLKRLADDFKLIKINPDLSVYVPK